MCMRYIVMWMGTTYGHSCLKWAALYSPSRANIWLTIMGWGIYLEKKTRHSIKRGTYIHTYISTVFQWAYPYGNWVIHLGSTRPNSAAKYVLSMPSAFVAIMDTTYPVSIFTYIHTHTVHTLLPHHNTLTGYSVVHVIHTYIHTQYIHYYHTTTHYLDTVWYMSYIHTYNEV